MSAQVSVARLSDSEQPSTVPASGGRHQIANIKLVENPGKSLVVIVKDG